MFAQCLRSSNYFQNAVHMYCQKDKLGLIVHYLAAPYPFIDGCTYGSPFLQRESWCALGMQPSY